MSYVLIVGAKSDYNGSAKAALTSQPEEVVEDIYTAQQKGKNVLYTKWMWRWVMMIIRNISEFQFKKMSI